MRISTGIYNYTYTEITYYILNNGSKIMNLLQNWLYL